MENISINTMADVRSFMYYLIVELDLGAGFHPDTPIAEYVNIDPSDPQYEQLTFHPDFAFELQERLDRCFQVCHECGEDIYSQGMDLVYTFGYLPRPDDDPKSPRHLIKEAYEMGVSQHSWSPYYRESILHNWMLDKSI